MSLRLHRHPISGHCHRVELLLSLLGLPYEAVTVDLRARAHKSPEFLAKNPFGQIPVLEDGDVVLADSNAILVYLALRHDPARTWLPAEPVGAARVEQWLAVAAGQLAYGPAAARRAAVFGRPIDPATVDAAVALFNTLDGWLADRRFLVGDAPTLADLAMYAYTERAPEGGVTLDAWPSIRSWLARVEALPGFVPMPRAAIPGA
jgi:glutathione S-transferase